ncbi:hypothetical protein CAPTEDRAFT_156595 [Capitella teleta]|uniref:SUMO-activating enzyme subunit 1 n=1 Tax=Capitella teleta TaxID=283909 RepID=R7TPV3_CAPTE|nr:hypothetical protein CAPTEDRAFT_156595 [Capitella teleta]|eukprot:ELT93541.1 hypothetical protein CAPTEDRAFT_156595 [Capitella teleta]
MLEKITDKITEDEAALYDRQIRLWGLDAQRRLRAARVLLIGVGGLGAEVAKNIVLSGIKSLTLLDHQVVTKEAFTSQFLIPRSELGKNRAESSLGRVQLLNPMVEISADPTDVADKEDAFFTDFDVVCATCCEKQQLQRLNEICHKSDILFFAGDVFGFYGAMFSDLNTHEYAVEVKQNSAEKAIDATSAASTAPPAAKKQKTEPAEMKTVKKTTKFTRFSSALNINWREEAYVKRLKRMPKTFFIYRVLLEFRSVHRRDPSVEHVQTDKEELKQISSRLLPQIGVEPTIIQEDFYDYCFAELCCVCAVVGGVLAQEIIKAVSQKDAPHRNFFFYDGVSGDGMVDCLA